MLGWFRREFLERDGVEQLHVRDGREVLGGAGFTFYPAVEAGEIDLFARGFEAGGRVGTGAAFLRITARYAAVFRGFVEGHEGCLDNREEGEEIVAGERVDAVDLAGGDQTVVTLDLFVVEGTGGGGDAFGHQFLLRKMQGGPHRAQVGVDIDERGVEFFLHVLAQVAAIGTRVTDQLGVVEFLENRECVGGGEAEFFRHQFLHFL